LENRNFTADIANEILDNYNINWDNVYLNFGGEQYGDKGTFRNR